MYSKLSLIILVAFACATESRAITYCGIQVDPYGFVSTDLFFDSRQVLAVRDGFAILWPKRVLCDKFGHDINDHGDWNLTSVHTRFGLLAKWKPSWPDTLLKGVVEGDFLGVNERFTASYRLRLAYLEVQTSKWSFLAGQYWHSLFTLDCFPDTISFGNGLPMEPLTRVPQVRFTYKHKKGELVLMAGSQRDFASVGVLGFDTGLIRNSVIPNLDFRLSFFPKKNVVIGANLDYKRLVPRIETAKGFAVNEKIDSIICQVYGAYNGERFYFRSKFVYGQNGADQLLLSGFAVKTRDPITGKETYENTQTLTCWADTVYWLKDKKTNFGVFGGFAKNIGSQDNLFIDPQTNQPVVFAFDPDIDYVYRVSPRMRYKTKNFQFGLELEITHIAYGTLDKRARVVNPCPTHNVRLLAELLYFF